MKTMPHHSTVTAVFLIMVSLYRNYNLSMWLNRKSRRKDMLKFVSIFQVVTGIRLEDAGSGESNISGSKGDKTIYNWIHSFQQKGKYSNLESEKKRISIFGSSYLT